MEEELIKRQKNMNGEKIFVFLKFKLHIKYMYKKFKYFIIIYLSNSNEFKIYK